MNCDALHREAVFTLLACLTLRSPLMNVMRRYVVSFTDPLDWAPIVKVQQMYAYERSSIGITPPDGWRWPDYPTFNVTWWFEPHELEFARRKLIKITPG